MKNDIAAVIMAGGKGERLRPITDTVPKPTVKIGERYAIESALMMLQRAGIKDAVITVRYRHEDIRSALGERFCGIRLSYFTEIDDIGTAGGVRAALGSAGEYSEAVILSGDTVTDIELTPILNLHRIKGAEATLILSRSDDPQRYGVVETDSDGKITAFREKPADAQPGSMINAGIYVLSKRAIEMIPKAVPFDFGHELFPTMLRRGERMYGMEGRGYWCDIGTPYAYISCCHDAASGKIGGFYADVSRSGAIVGENCAVADGSELRGCVLFDGVTVGYDTRAKSSVFCRGVTVGSRVTVGDGCVIGEGSYIADGVRIPAGTLISPGSAVGAGVFAENL